MSFWLDFQPKYSPTLSTQRCIFLPEDLLFELEENYISNFRKKTQGNIMKTGLENMYFVCQFLTGRI